MRTKLIVALLAVFAVAFGIAQTPAAHKFAVQKTQQEWKKVLSPEAFHILRESGTEAPYTGDLWDFHEEGTYACAGCGQVIFSSKTKFESHTGWPSFWQTVSKKVVIEQPDHSDGDNRTEVLCSRCGGHLGHVFDDGPKPTGLRYCMNSPALKFKKASK